MKHENAASPLVPEGEVEWIRNISIPWLVNNYKSAFGLDVSRFFEGIDSLMVYRCKKSGYEYFCPGITGDSKFYEKLQEFDWYYMPWKWEHDIALTYLDEGYSVLEVGCAHGAFLQGACSKKSLGKVVGLELNESASGNKNFDIVNQKIVEFEKENNDSFDMVCSFQVLEHIPDVFQALQAMISCLKKGGKLLISVPNNDSFLKDGNHVLNMPPHHVGLWNQASLTYLAKQFPLRILGVHFEPLQSYHVEMHLHSSEYSKYPKILSKIIKKIDRLTGRYQSKKKVIDDDRHAIAGHTILFVYEKI